MNKFVVGIFAVLAAFTLLSVGVAFAKYMTDETGHSDQSTSTNSYLKVTAYGYYIFPGNGTTVGSLVEQVSGDDNVAITKVEIKSNFDSAWTTCTISGNKATCDKVPSGSSIYCSVTNRYGGGKFAFCDYTSNKNFAKGVSITVTGRVTDIKSNVKTSSRTFTTR